MRILFTLLILLTSLTAFGQRFEIVGASVEGQKSQVNGEVYIDIDNKSVALKINGREMIITKMNFRKGDVGELFCFKETIEAKQRFKFSPNKERKGDMINVSHVLTYTVVTGFSNRRNEFIYYLAKKRKS